MHTQNPNFCLPNSATYLNKTTQPTAKNNTMAIKTEGISGCARKASNMSPFS